jgi:extradiol dioxygenase family protein
MTERQFPLFHHAFPVDDLAGARAFYAGLLGCKPGQQTARTANFEFFGHHLIAHLVEGEAFEVHRRATAGRNIALRHFGVALPWGEYEALRGRLEAEGASFIVPHEVRHAGEPGEEALMLLTDPSGNVVEFKTFRDIEYLFSKH